MIYENSTLMFKNSISGNTAPRRSIQTRQQQTKDRTMQEVLDMIPENIPNIIQFNLKQF